VHLIATGSVIRVETIGFQALSSKLSGIKLLGPPVRKMFQEATTELQRDVRSYVHVDTGKLQRSIVKTVSRSKIPLTAKVYSRLHQANPIEAGRGAGKSSPPSSALVGWVRRHGFGAGVRQSVKTQRYSRAGGAQTVEQAAFLLARSIGRKGIRAERMFKQAATTFKGKMDRYISQAAHDIEAEWGKR
jgi:hypothetical protein